MLPNLDNAKTYAPFLVGDAERSQWYASGPPFKLIEAALSLPAPVPIPHLNNQFYGHGAFFGASGQLLNDKVWSEVLKVLMPDVAGSVEKVLESGGGSKDVLLKFENNPIAGAYGIMKLKELDDEKVCRRLRVFFSAFFETGFLG